MNRKIIYAVLLLILLVGCTTGPTTKFYENYMEAKEYFLLSAQYRESGNYYYEQFVVLYEDSMFLESIEYCKEARDYYSEANSNQNYAMRYFEIAREYASPEYKDLIDDYFSYGNISIELNWYNFEACEYLEAAAYDYYNERYEEGNRELDSANEKTVSRDNLVRDLNEVATRIKVKEKSIGIN